MMTPQKIGKKNNLERGIFLSTLKFTGHHKTIDGRKQLTVDQIMVTGLCTNIER
jgi:hypothetical protein